MTFFCQKKSWTLRGCNFLLREPILLGPHFLKSSGPLLSQSALFFRDWSARFRSERENQNYKYRTLYSLWKSPMLWGPDFWISAVNHNVFVTWLWKPYLGWWNTFQKRGSNTLFHQNKYIEPLVCRGLGAAMSSLFKLLNSVVSATQ